MTKLIGKEIGNYRVVERIGMGGMAEVYLGKHKLLDRFVAIKVLHSYLLESGNFIERFKREANAVANLRHPNIVQLFDFEIQDEIIYMVMEYIEGTNLQLELKQLVQDGRRFPVSKVKSIVHDIAKALDYAHALDMLHRDVKPSNILVDKDGKAYLTDFGIAKILSEHKLTATGTLVGTPAYMSPEQCRGGTLTRQSDLYSLGIILFEMLTGFVPFDSETPIAIIHKQIADPIPDLAEYLEGVPSVLQGVINKVLAKSPQERYTTGIDLAMDLENALRSLESSQPGSNQPPHSGDDDGKYTTPILGIEKKPEPSETDHPTIPLVEEKKGPDYHTVQIEIDKPTVKMEDFDLPDEDTESETLAFEGPTKAEKADLSTADVVEEIPYFDKPTSVMDETETPTVPMDSEDFISSQRTMPMDEEPVISLEDEQDLVETAPLEGVESESVGEPKPEKLGLKARLGKIPIWGWIGAAVILLGFVLVIWLQPTQPPTSPVKPNPSATPTSQVVSAESTEEPLSMTDKKETAQANAADLTAEVALTPTETYPPVPTRKPTATPWVAKEVILDVAHTDDGLSIAPSYDLDTEIVFVGDDQVQAWRTGGGRVLPSPDDNDVADFYMAFNIDDTVIYEVAKGRRVSIEVEYLDEGFDKFRIEYDAHEGGPYNTGIFKSTGEIKKTNTKTFQIAEFILEDAYFANRNNSYDFRLDDMADGAETIRGVTVTLFPVLSGEEYYLEGTGFREQGDYRKEIQFLLLAIGTGYETGDLYSELALAYVETGQIENSFQALDRGLEIDPNDPHLYRAKSEYLWTYQQDAVRAMQEINTAIALAPEDPWMYESRAALSSQTGQYQLCVEDFTMFFDLGEEMYGARYARGFCYVNLGEFDLARQDFERFLVLAPNIPETEPQRQEVQAWLDSH